MEMDVGREGTVVAGDAGRSGSVAVIDRDIRADDRFAVGILCMNGEQRVAVAAASGAAIGRPLEGAVIYSAGFFMIEQLFAVAER